MEDIRVGDIVRRLNSDDIGIVVMVNQNNIVRVRFGNIFWVGRSRILKKLLSKKQAKDNNISVSYFVEDYTKVNEHARFCY